MTSVISFLPVACLDQLVEATGFNLGPDNYDYKLKWLIERIGMLRESADKAAIVHDNPTVADLTALIQQERRWSAGLDNTIQGMMAELEVLRGKK